MQGGCTCGVISDERNVGSGGGLDDAADGVNDIFAGLVCALLVPHPRDSR